jgi:hypothetical protein
LRYIRKKSPFLPQFLGALKSEWILLPRQAPAFWEGPNESKGGTDESRRRADAGRRNYPEAVPEKMSGGNGTWIESSN